MPSYLRGAPGSACWNCDRATGEVAVVTIRTPTGGEATFALCRRCSDAAAAISTIGEDAGIEITREEGRSGPA